MSDNSSSSSSGIGFTGLLTVLFVGLKLTGFIAWSWWWVLSPLWIGTAIAAVGETDGRGRHICSMYTLRHSGDVSPK